MRRKSILGQDLTALLHRRLDDQIHDKKIQIPCSSFQIEQKHRPPAHIEIRHRAAAGAVLGAVGGPVGAAVGGVVGAVVGKRAESEPLMPMVKRAARQTARGVKAAAKAARVALPAAKRVVKSIRRGKGKTTKSGARKSRTAKTGSRSEKSKPTVTKARRHSSGRKNRIKGNRARAKKPRR